MRRLIIVFLLALGLAVVAPTAPAAADPPERFEEPFVFVFPDFEHGFWVFSNIDRDFVCTGEGFLGLGSFQAVETRDAVVLRITALEAPTALHPIVGEPGPDFNPCDNSDPDPMYVGSVDARANDNDGPNLGARANAFGDRARGIVHDNDGLAYQYGWTFKVVFPPDANAGPEFEFDPDWIRVDKYFFHPIDGRR